MNDPARRLCSVGLWSFALATVVGCGGNRLGEYDYRAHSLSVVSDVPPRPEVLSSPVFLARPRGDPVRDMVRIGARVVREVEARDVQERLDSASVLVDIGGVLEENTLERAARYLGADAVPGEPDANYILELIVLEYGIDAEAWDAAAHFYLEADATLLHGDSGTEIWRKKVTARDPIAPAVFGRPSAVRDVVTAAALASLSVDEMVEVLESLADFSARVVTDRLRDDLRDARER